MLNLFVFVVAGTNAILHDSKPDFVAATPFDQVIAQSARFGTGRQIVQVPDLMFAVVLALVVTMVPTAIAPVASALEMPSGRMSGERNLALLAVFEKEQDVAALECLHG